MEGCYYGRNVCNCCQQYVILYHTLTCIGRRSYFNNRRYDKKTDAMICAIRPHFGDRRWVLPLAMSPILDERIGARWFARVLLEGKVPGVLKDFVSGLIVSPALLTKNGAASHRAVQGLLSAVLGTGRQPVIVSRRILVARWREEPLFMQAELCKWMKTAQQKKLKATWGDMVRKVTKSKA